MKTKQSFSTIKNQKINLHDEIIHLLDKDGISKKEILKALQEKHQIDPSDIRRSIREVRTDFLKKLNILQSGVAGV